MLYQLHVAVLIYPFQSLKVSCFVYVAHAFCACEFQSVKSSMFHFWFVVYVVSSVAFAAVGNRRAGELIVLLDLLPASSLVDIICLETLGTLKGVYTIKNSPLFM